MKTKFNPDDVPDWCKWIAVDGDGEVYGYRLKPYHRARIQMWVNPSSTELAFLLYTAKPPKNFKTELYTWS